MSELEVCDISVSELIDDFLIKKSLEDNDRDNLIFHPSEFHGCKRKISYQYHEATGFINVVLDQYSVNTRLCRIFDNGHKVHDRYKEYLSDPRCAPGLLKGRWKCKNKWAHNEPKIVGLEEKFGVFRPETPCECGSTEYEYVEVGFLSEVYNIGGHVDVILFLPNGQHIIIDFKSIGYRGFDRLFAQPEDKHYTQMQLYLFLSGEEAGKFLYEDKNDQRIKEFLVIRDQKYIDRLLIYAEHLKDIVTYEGPNGQRKLAPRSNSTFPETDDSPYLVKYTPKHYECINCRFKNNCYKKDKK